MDGRQLYEQIGRGYSVGRRTDPRIAAALHGALGDARTVLNVGAGAGSYEPQDRDVVALEPSRTMLAQRPSGTAPAVAGVAEQLPFRDQAFDAAMAVLSDHHWTDPLRGLQEMRRVARRVVLLQWDPQAFRDFWLIREYVPEMDQLGRRGPSLAARAAVLDADVSPVPIPADCVDGFFHAYWRRPEAYLDPMVRRCTSVWARVGRVVEERAVEALRRDLASGAWHERNAHLLALDEADVGARILVSRGT